MQKPGLPDATPPPARTPVRKPRTTAPRPAAAKAPKRAPRAKPAPVVVTHEMIAVRAYEIYLSRGDGGGDPLADWITAEQELRAAEPAPTKPKATRTPRRKPSES